MKDRSDNPHTMIEHSTTELHHLLPLTRKETFYLTTQSTHFILQLYGVRHMVTDHSDSERGNLLLPHGLLFPISRQDNTYHSHGALAGTRNSWASNKDKLTETTCMRWALQTSTTELHHILPLTKEGKEGNVLFNNTINTFYLRLYGIRPLTKTN